jgi:hypothetical protein
MSWRRTVVMLAVGLALGAARAAAAGPGGPLSCFDERHNGPCMSPDPAAFFPAKGQDPAVMVANFALVFPGSASAPWQYVCDDLYGRPAPERIRRSPNGELLLPTTAGLQITRDGCSFQQATGSIAGGVVYDVAVDEKDPQVVFALVGTPRALMRSNDGGRSFNTVFTFEQGLLLTRVIVPPTRTKEVYVLGHGRGAMTPMGVSTDDGVTFTMRDAAERTMPLIKTSFELLATHPTDPATLYFTVILGDGDEVWQTTDAGVTAKMLLKVAETEAVGGLAFGSTPSTIYVGGHDLFPERGMPAGHLYISRDAGATWLPPVPSPETGPQFSCLSAAGTELFACGAGATQTEDTMVATSSDEGKTWRTLSRLGDLSHTKACAREQCVAVADWLCNTYTTCGPGQMPMPISDAGPPPDGGVLGGTGGSAGTKDAGPTFPTPKDDSGCGCRLGAQTRGSAAGLLVLVGALLAWAARRRR